MRKQLTRIGVSTGAAASALAVSISNAFAQTFTINVPNISGNQVPSNLGNLINAGVTLFLIIAIVIAFFFLIWGGVQWISSGGDKAATQSARERITASLVGLLVVFGTYLILTVASTFLGFGLTNINIPSAK